MLSTTEGSSPTGWVVALVAAYRVGSRLDAAAMDTRDPFLSTEALATGALTRHELRRYHRAVMPGVYVDKRATLSLRQRIVAAWLWSGRQAVVSGRAASAVHGAKWVDDDTPVELTWRNARAPRGVVTSNAVLLEGESERRDGMLVTSPERTAFDIGRRSSLGTAVAELDSLAAATGFKVPDVQALADSHRGARNLRQLETALGLVDAGAESPKETWVRLLLIDAGYRRPRTQIPVLRPDGRGYYYLDMGWKDPKIAVEYEGDHHRTDKSRFAYEIERLETLDRLGWIVIRVSARHQPADILRRVQRAWELRSTLR